MIISRQNFEAIRTDAIVVIIFLAFVLLTQAHYWGDSADYVDSMLAFERGIDYEFSEFGHLVWRPLGWVVWKALFMSDVADHWRIEAFRTLQCITLICGLSASIIYSRILRDFGFSHFISIAVVVFFLSSHVILNFSQTGNSYIPGFLWYLCGIYFAFRGKETSSNLDAIACGFFLALSFCFWIAYLWGIPAVLLGPAILFGIKRERVSFVMKATLSLVITLIVFFGIAIYLNSIDSVEELRNWIIRSAHEEETRGVARAIFGTARSFVYLGNDGIVFKRFLLKDPLNPVDIFELARVGLLGLFLVATLFLSLFCSLWRGTHRRLGFVFAVGFIPVFAFATQHGGGEAQWHLAHFPFLFLCVGAAISAPANHILRVSVITLLTLVSAFNLWSLSNWETNRRLSRDFNRIARLDENADKRDLVFLVSFSDSLVAFNRGYPFHPLNNQGQSRFSVLTTPGTAQTAHWREEFAVRTLNAWANGRSVWVTGRAFAARPEPEWNWAEGDDPKVTWTNFPEFLNAVETDQVSDSDAFVLVLQTASNQALMTRYAAEYPKNIFLE